MLWFVLGYVLIAAVLTRAALRAKNLAVPPMMRAFEDAEQMDAVRPRLARGTLSAALESTGGGHAAYRNHRDRRGSSMG